MKKVTLNAPDPELSTKDKLKQIRSGEKLKRTKSGLQRKSIVIDAKDGSKIIKNQTEEQFEETGVRRKKRNYVMYESKLMTEKNTQITELKKKKKPVRQPSPRIEEKIYIQKKRKDYLDNYQYHESKVLKDKNPKAQVIVMHQRLGSEIGGYEEKTYQQNQIIATGPQIPGGREIKYSTKTTIIKSPNNKPVQTPYKPTPTLYKPMQTPYRKVQTPYKPTIQASYNKFSTTTYKPLYTPYKPTQSTQSHIASLTSTTFKPVFSPYKPTQIKTPYPRMRENKTQILNVNTSSRNGARTPGIKSNSTYQIKQSVNNKNNFTINNYNTRQPNNYIIKRTENVTNQIMPRKVNTPYISSGVNNISNNKLINQFQSKNLYKSTLEPNDNKKSKIILSKSGIFSEKEPKGRVEDESYDTKTITTISRFNRRLDEDLNNRNSNNNEKSNDNRRENSRVEIKIEKRTKVIDESGTYGIDLQLETNIN